MKLIATSQIIFDLSRLHGLMRLKVEGRRLKVKNKDSSAALFESIASNYLLP